MKKQEKIFFVENLTEELKSAKSVVLINYAGLSVANQRELVSRLKGVGAKMLVVKNTLLKRAAEAAKVDKEILTEGVLTGQTALVIAEDDPLAPLGVLGKFAKEFVSRAGDSVPQFKVGLVDGSFQDTEALEKLSALPSKDALLGQLLGTLMSPSSGLVGTLNANMQKLIFVLKSKAG
ncbi:MAG: ribosomal protein L10 [Candidatus Woesebacteria bacterium GW2011_GWC2_47_16]|uniref:Large ribosomal subunit protein uL10 n=8 Tax=Candidatus Woeseibacteriota TaxID=1752722 RepID=A0A0G1T2N9_9BACT|nr:MAG: ribosomal protein L10 [Candidatus Woesebacteria bacterium GW2011_GWE1_45_18]KKU25037.1 MAG: ribosomal protein L10 [Candidatus Woesebacteria bacterium GW2011_GWF1_46_13]KKU48468.1 MAG: ribosomal protein L10 [Candidatus Woesebacteria bacterium GW2011_GWF2_46_8]KKU63428.1 MAG: ribosomal protein L10 [Candidatus Woesebacteria bacterium GW2011_GWC2_47_16]KKU70179.1 MAG: ribosomal protein L10 [Candidatus Woesebacteria bacterium GW2011_GWD1_47_21]OGM77122.1 MAG: 50S ribosomal protein L10 [Cand